MLKSLTTSLLTKPFNALLPVLRFKSRRGTRLRREARKARIKALKASQPKPPPYVPFMHRVEQMLNKGRIGIHDQVQASAGSSSISLNWPSRLLQTLEPIHSDDDVFRLSETNYRTTFLEALQLLRRLNDKTIYDDPISPVIMRLDLNMNIDNSNDEYIDSIKTLLVLPHIFEYGKRRVIMAFTKQPDAQMDARVAGAEFAGGEDVIRKIRRGELKVDEIDYFVANLDVVQDLASIRGILKDKLPTQSNGLLGLDVVPLVKHYRNAVTVPIIQDSSKPAWGVCQMVVGKTDMTDQQIEDNVSFLIKRLCQHRPLAVSLGHFIHRALIVCPDRRTYFPWKFEEYSPPIPDNDLALQALADKEVDKKKKKKKKKA